jgi:hypothetical protein
MNCLVFIKKNKKSFYSSAVSYRYFKCRCQNCKNWKNEENKKYRKVNKNSKYNKVYYIKNKESILEFSKKKYKNNKNLIRKYQSQYSKTENGLEANRRGARKRRALKRNSSTYKYTEKQVLDTYGKNCYLCGKTINMSNSRQVGKKGWESGLHIEHVVDIALGGPDTLQNVRPSHGLCNLTKKSIKVNQ